MLCCATMFTLQLLTTNYDQYPVNTSSISPLVQIIQSANGYLIYLWLHNSSIMSSNTFSSNFDKTFKLQISIGQIIDDTLYNWDNSLSKIAIESFKRKTHCLVIVKLGEWRAKHHYSKCAMTLRPNEPQDLLKLKNILYFLGEF